MTVSQAPALGFATQLPDPGHLWLRFTPRHWRGPQQAWTDCAEGRLHGPARRRHFAGPLPEAPSRPFDDCVYLPPVEAPEADERDRLARELVRSGAPVLVQVAAGQPAPDLGASVVHDLLGVLLARDLATLATLPRGALAVWPLIAAVTDDAAFVRSGLEALRAARVAHVQGLTLEIAPADRRWLSSEVDDRRYDRLFHAPPPSERDFAVLASSYGFAPFVPRPLPPSPPTPAWMQNNRRLGAILAEAAELWLRLGRPVGRGQALYRAMRHVDRCRLDLGALAREGNLGVLEWLDGESRTILEQAQRLGGCDLLEDLRAQYTARIGPRP